MTIQKSSFNNIGDKMKKLLLITLFANSALATTKKIDSKTLDVEASKRTETRDQEIEDIQRYLYDASKGYQNYKTKSALYNELNEKTENLHNEFRKYSEAKEESLKRIEEYNQDFACKQDKTKCKTSENSSEPQSVENQEQFEREKLVNKIIQNKDQIKSCFDDLLSRKPETGIQKATVVGSINIDGSLSISAFESNSREPDLEKCVIGVFESIKIDSINEKVSFKQQLNFNKYKI
jgi:hypothetical protein